MVVYQLISFIYDNKNFNFFSLIIMQKLKNKREANEVEFFDITYQTKKGTYVEDTTRTFMVYT